MDKRYQVFISSTFADLQEERAQVQQMIMQLNCIPAGMELFPAIDEEQLEFIKRIIDDSDYYILIIGGRYGSLSADGISYTEKEYNYAVSKGIKVIALLHQNPKGLPFDKSEKDASARRKLDRFRKKVSADRVVLFWNEANELPAKVAMSLPVTIKTYPAVGWVRASLVPDSNLYKELNDLRKENDELKSKIRQTESLEEVYNVAGFGDKLTVKGRSVSSNLGESSTWQLETTWGDIFYMIAPGLQVLAPEKDIMRHLSSTFHSLSTGQSKQNGIEIIRPSAMAMRIQLRALDLIEISAISGMIAWKLTQKGERLMLINQARRKPTAPE